MIITTRHFVDNLNPTHGPASARVANAGAPLIAGTVPVDECEFIGLPAPPADVLRVNLRAPDNPGGGWDHHQGTGWYDQNLVCLREDEHA